MERKSESGSPPIPSQALGEYLRNLRDSLRLTLREVEEASRVSNAYLSQLEHGKISKPSPHILFKLAAVYGVPYEKLMEKAGYITRAKPDASAKQKSRGGKLPTFALEDLTEEEEEELLRYLAFLRSRKGRK